MTTLTRLGSRSLVALVAVLALMMTLMVSTVSAVTYATVTGYAAATEDNNHPETWGEDCEDIGVTDVDSFVLPALEEGLVYDLVIVKAGSDSEQSGGNNTLFGNASAGETVWADTNESGLFDEGDKTISHIIVCTAEEELGSITVDKVVTGTNASTSELFSFGVTGETGFTLSAAGAPVVFDELEANVYVVNEAALTAGQTSAGWTFTSVSCTGGGTVVSGASATVTLAEGQDVVCTFSNAFAAPVVNTPTLSLEKSVGAGNANLGFGFTLGGTPLANTVTAAAPPLLLASAAGPYVIGETAQAGWNLTGIDCVGNAAAESVNLTARTVSVTVGANEDVVCTFTNAPEGTQSGNPPSTPPSQAATPVRQGTLASSVPNTAMDGGRSDQLPVALIALVALASLAYVARRNAVATKLRS